MAGELEVLRCAVRRLQRDPGGGGVDRRPQPSSRTRRRCGCASTIRRLPASPTARAASRPTTATVRRQRLHPRTRRPAGSAARLKLAGTGYVQLGCRAARGAYSVSLWFKSRPAPNWRPLLGHPRRAAGLTGTLPQQGEGLRRDLRESICTASMLADGRWTTGTTCRHTRSRPGRQKIYLDGARGWPDRIASLPGHRPQAGSLGVSETRPAYLTGSIDDVRLFDRALTPAEVPELADLSIFHMDFDQTDRWADVSSFHDGSWRNCGTTCPAHLAQRGQRRGRATSTAPSISACGHLLAARA